MEGGYARRDEGKRRGKDDDTQTNSGKKVVTRRFRMGLEGEGKKGREGKAGEIMNGCKQKWGPFRYVARQGGVW